MLRQVRLVRASCPSRLTPDERVFLEQWAGVAGV